MCLSDDRFCHTAQQESPNTSVSSRPEQDNVSVPLSGAIDDRFAHVTTFDNRIY